MYQGDFEAIKKDSQAAGNVPDPENLFLLMVIRNVHFCFCEAEEGSTIPFLY